MPFRLNRLLTVIAAAVGLLILHGCDAAEPDDGRVVEGVDLDALFAPPRASEVDAILQEWSTRTISAETAAIVAAMTDTLGGVPMEVRIVRHQVDGIQHYGAIAVLHGAEMGTLPVLVYAHGGDEGVNLEDLDRIVLALGELGRRFVYVVPSFRSEDLVYAGATYVSEGAPSPWDRDVDDALALIDVTLATTPEADPERMAVAGFSRGGGVALLMGIRDPRIDIVIDFFGPTDFFDPFVQDVAADALRGTVRELPGAAFLNATYLQPLKSGDLTIDQVRLELVRRSAVLFAAALPDVQVHHGGRDDVVPVSQAQSLQRTMQQLGRSAPTFEAYIYPGGGHDVEELPGSISRARDFLSRFFIPEAPALAATHAQDW